MRGRRERVPPPPVAESDRTSVPAGISAIVRPRVRRGRSNEGRPIGADARTPATVVAVDSDGAKAHLYPGTPSSCSQPSC